MRKVMVHSQFAHPNFEGNKCSQRIHVTVVVMVDSPRTHELHEHHICTHEKSIKNVVIEIPQQMNFMSTRFAHKNFREKDIECPHSFILVTRLGVPLISLSSQCRGHKCVQAVLSINSAHETLMSKDVVNVTHMAIASTKYARMKITRYDTCESP